MVEGASFTELALPSFFPELAWNRLIVGMDGAKSSFTEIFRKRIIRLSQIFLTMSELAVLGQWALVLLEIMLAQLSFVFLFQGVELTLISVEVVVV